MSAFLEKQKLLDWLRIRSENTGDKAYSRLLGAVVSGQFGWTSEGE